MCIPKEQTGNDMSKNKSKLVVLITLAVIIVGVALGYAFIRNQHKTPQEPALTIDTKDQPTLGNANAPLHFVVFEDLKCGNCKIFTNTLFPEIKKEYVDKGTGKYTLINLAFIQGSMPAANAAHCLYEQNKDYFFPFVDYVYANQPPEEEDWATMAKILQFAQAAVPKADLNKLSQCMVENRYYNFLENNLKLAATLMKGQVATPTLYINGRQVLPLTMNQIKKMVQEEQK